MRRFLALILCLMMFTTTVYASNAVSTAASTGTVSGNGACQITLTATIRLDSSVSSLSFPIGTDVSGVTLNGSGANLKRDNGVMHVNLNYLKNQTGAFPITIHYTVNNIVITDEETGKQTIRIPLLHGFRYPVEQMRFSVTMPSEFHTEPVFFSGYHEQDIERSITYTIEGNTISGTVNTQLKDFETLFLTLAAPEGMFPQAQAAGGSLVFDNWAIGTCIVLSLLYWFATMARLPLWPSLRSTVPDGVSAGVVGSYLVRKPADLTMMVVHWAQLGYLIIHLDDNGRVILHKKMEMGNERNAFEQRCFRSLFGKKQMADATGYRYARIWEDTARTSLRYASGFRKESGSPLILRILSTGVGLFCGIAIGDCVSTSPAWRIIWMLLGAVITTLTVWQLQKGMYCFRLQDKTDLIYGMLWALLVLAAGILIYKGTVYALIAVGWGILAGVMGTFGGKRSENGQRTYADLVALRRYMRTVTKEELGRILRANPNYYYELAPFAIAMGVDKKLAKQFASLRIPACTWLVVGMEHPRTPNEWYPLLRETVQAMNALAKRPFWEKYSNR